MPNTYDVKFDKQSVPLGKPTCQCVFVHVECFGESFQRSDSILKGPRVHASETMSSARSVQCEQLTDVTFLLVL